MSGERRRYEASDIPPGRIALILIGLILALLILCGAVAAFLHLLDRAGPPMDKAIVSPPPEPRLQVDETRQRRAIETATHPDRIDEAMQRTVAEGWDEGR